MYLHNNSPFRNAPQRMPEMSPPPPFGTGKKCLALDLDETLVHSSFQVILIAYHVMSCRAMSCHVMSCHVMSYHVLSHHILPYRILHITQLHSFLSGPITLCPILSCYVFSLHLSINLLHLIVPLPLTLLIFFTSYSPWIARTTSYLSQ
jgi:hypothetical protein